MIMETQEEDQQQQDQNVQPWLQYASPPPKSSRIEELAQNPLAILAIGIIIGVVLMTMRPIVIQTAKGA